MTRFLGEKRSDQKNRQELMLTRFMGRKWVIAAVLCVETVVWYLVVNYLVNLVCNMPALLNDLGHPAAYVGFSNCFPKWERIKAYPQFYLVWHIIFFVVCLIHHVRQGYRMRTAFSSHGFNLAQKGCARWTTDEEIKKQYKKIPDRDKPFHGYGGTIVSRMGMNLYIDDSMVNTLIRGITRSGKGEMFVIPEIDVYSRAEIKSSLVITDPKLELFKCSKKTLEERGYRVFLLSLADPEHSMGFNPLEQIIDLYITGDFSNAELLAQSFSYSIFNPDKPINGDSFWQDMPSSLLTALILAQLEDCYEMDEMVNQRRLKVWERKRKVYEKLSAEEKKEAKTRWISYMKEHPEGDAVMEPSLAALPEAEKFKWKKEHIKKVNMYSIINSFGQMASKKNLKNPNISLLDHYFNYRPDMDRAKMKYFGIGVAGDRTKDGIFASMMAKLTVFTYENIAKMTAESTLNLEDIGFGDEPVAVFLEVPDWDKSTHFLATVFIRQMYFVLSRKASRTKGGKCKNRVRIITDEFGNIPAIENMENIITVCLGRNIAFDLFIQADSQLKKLYGDNATTIIGNCGNQIYILSDDDETTKRFSQNLGNETIIDMSRDGNRLSSKKRITERPVDKPLLNFNELEELRPGECVVRRTMKRTDLEGRSITPRPIFNSEESGKRFLFRYEYLTDTFPNPDEIDISDVNKEDRTHIKLQEIVWDYNLSFALLKSKTEQAAKKETPETVDELENKEAILSVLKDVWKKDIPFTMPISALKRSIQQSDLTKEQIYTFLQLIEIGKRNIEWLSSQSEGVVP